MSALATIRPDDVNVALLVHVLGAMTLVGSLFTAAVAAIVGWRAEDDRLRRISYKTLLFVALPAFIVMYAGALWTYDKENLDALAEEPAWIGIGFLTADLGAVLLLIALILGGIGLRRSRSGGGGPLLRASGAIATLLVLVYIVAVWAMGGKPN